MPDFDIDLGELLRPLRGRVEKLKENTDVVIEIGRASCRERVSSPV